MVYHPAYSMAGQPGHEFSCSMGLWLGLLGIPGVLFRSESQHPGHQYVANRDGFHPHFPTSCVEAGSLPYFPMIQIAELNKSI